MEISEEEKATAEIALKRWNRFVEKGIPIQNEYIARTTGIRIDNETGEHTIDTGAGSPLNADGSIKTDATDANTAFESAATQQLYGQGNVDPNRSVLSMESGQNELIAGHAASAGRMKFQQQSNYLQGVDNVARIGQGIAAENVSSQAQLAQQASNEAINAASVAQANRQANADLTGKVAGAATYLGARKYQAGNDLQNPVIPGNQNDVTHLPPSQR